MERTCIKGDGRAEKEEGEEERAGNGDSSFILRGE